MASGPVGPAYGPGSPPIESGRARLPSTSIGVRPRAQARDEQPCVRPCAGTDSECGVGVFSSDAMALAVGGRRR